MEHHSGNMGTGSPAEDPSSTSTGLIQRVKSGDDEAWETLSQVYGYFVYRRARQSGLQPADASDLVQDVFCSVARSIRDFRLDRPGDSFRGWLWTITTNEIRRYFNRRGLRTNAAGGTDALERLQQVPDLPLEDSSSITDETNVALAHWMLESVKVEFESRTWEAFCRVTIDRRRPADVAQDLGMSVAAVYQAKSRVLRRIREKLSGTG